MSNFFLYMVGAFGLVSIGILGCIINRSLTLKLQSVFLIIAGACIAYFSLGNRFGHTRQILLYASVILIIFLFIFLTSVIIYSKSGNGKTTDVSEKP